jgi:5,10-methylenetetrahydromethanopterin reductase
MGRGTLFGIKLASHYLPVDEMLTLARHVEALGYHSVWTTEGRMAPDAVTTTAAIAALTDRVRIGTSVLNPFSRSPGVIAVSAASIDQISRGRFVLGIGAGDPPTLEKQHIPYHRPVRRLRECVTVVRELWAGKRVDYQGETLHVTDLEMDFGPYADPIPVYIGAAGPRALRQANEIGDGILLNVCVPAASAAEVVAMADRDRGVKVIGNIVVGLHRDAEVAVRGMKPLVVRYLTRFPAIARISGVPDALLQRLRDAAQVGIEEACAVLPDDYVTQLAAVGSPQDCRRWITDYTVGMDEALLMPAFGDARETIDELADLVR